MQGIEKELEEFRHLAEELELKGFERVDGTATIEEVDETVPIEDVQEEQQEEEQEEVPEEEQEEEQEEQQEVEQEEQQEVDPEVGETSDPGCAVSMVNTLAESVQKVADLMDSNVENESEDDGQFGRLLDYLSPRRILFSAEMTFTKWTIIKSLRLPQKRRTMGNWHPLKPTWMNQSKMLRQSSGGLRKTSMPLNQKK